MIFKDSFDKMFNSYTFTLLFALSISTHLVASAPTQSKELNDVGSIQSKDFTCRSLCNGEYDICLDAIRSFWEKFICYQNLHQCIYKCKTKKPIASALQSSNDVMSDSIIKAQRKKLKQIWS